MRIDLMLLFLLAVFSAALQPSKSLPHIDLVAPEGLSWEEKVPAKLLYTDQIQTVDFSVKAKYRGGKSSAYFKHSFTVKLDRHAALGGLPGDNDWILNASYIDKTFMRHRLSYDLFRAMHPENIAPRASFITLSENGNYQGVYVLMERLDGSRLRINKKDTSACIFKDPPIFFPDSSVIPQDTSNYFHQKFPDREKTDRSVELGKLMNLLFDASDEEFTKRIAHMVDLRNVRDWHLLLLFSNNGDGVLKNFYLYKPNDQTPFRFAPWDYDHSFGRDGDGELNLNERHEEAHRSVLLRRLMQTNAQGYADSLYARYADLRASGVFSESGIQARVAQYRSELEDELNQNFERWPVNGEHYYDAMTFDEELDVIDQFLTLRIAYLDSVMGYSRTH